MNVVCITTSRADWATMGEVARHLRHAGVRVHLVVASKHAAIKQIMVEWGIDDLYRYGHVVAEKGATEEVSLLYEDGATLGPLGSLLNAIQPSAVLIAGDRHEALQAAFCAAMLGFTVAHIAGGDTSTGSLDERWRHAMTKIADLHFPTNAKAAARIAQMGEPLRSIHMVGSPSIDRLNRTPIMPRADLCSKLGLPDARPFLLANWQPGIASSQELPELLRALSSQPHPGVFVGVGEEAGTAEARREIAEMVVRHPRWELVGDLSLDLYLNALWHCMALIGNSSSGYYEAPFYGTPVIDVGTRQQGRGRLDNVMCVPSNLHAIQFAIRAISAQTGRLPPSFPYGHPGASAKIAEIIKGLPSSRPGNKEFVFR